MLRNRFHVSLFALLLLAGTTHLQAATGPTVFGPENVRDNCTLTLDPAGVTGTWTIDWGDGTITTEDTSATDTSHTYADTIVFTIKVTLKNTSNVTVDVQRNYTQLVTKTGPSLYYNFEDPAGSQPSGPAVVKQGVVTDIASFSASTGTAERLTGSGSLRMADQSAVAANFFGLEFWLRPNNLMTRQMIYAGVGSGDGNVKVYIESGNLCFEQVGAGVKSIPLGADVQPGLWYHFGVSLERSPYYMLRNSVRFYRDGLLFSEQSYAFTESRPVNYTGATIGGYDAGSGTMANLLNGDIDEVVLHPLGIFPGSFLERDRAATSNEASWRVTVGQDGAESFTVDRPNISTDPAATIPVTLSTTAENNFTTLQNALKNATAGTRLKIVDENNQPGGTFKIGQSSNDNISMLVFNGKTDVEVDGNGATLLVTEPLHRYLTVSNCTRVAVKNLSFDLDQTVARVAVYAQVESYDAANKRFVLRFVKGVNNDPDVVPSPEFMNFWRIRQADNATRATKAIPVKTADGNSFLVPTGMVKTPDPSDGSRWTISVTNAATDGLWTNLAAVKSAGDVLQITNNNFAGTGTLTWGCKHLTFDHVNYYGVLGMVFLTGNPDASDDLSKNGRFDYMKVSNCRVGLPPGQTVHDRAFVSSADGFQFYQADGGHLLFENNDVSMTNDDAVVIKDPIYLRSEKTGTNQLKTGAAGLPIAKIAINSTVELRNLNLEPLSPPFSATVTAYDAATKTVTLNQAVPGAVGAKYHVLNRAFQTADWMLRGNNIHDVFGRMMLYTHDGTAENNRFSLGYFHIGFCVADYDYAGDPYNLVFRNNLITGYGDTSSWWANPTQQIFEDLAFTNNSFRGYWKLNNVVGLNIASNYFEHVDTRFSGVTNPNAYGLVQLAESNSSTVAGNVNYDPVTTAFVTKDATSACVEWGNTSVPSRANAADVIVDNGSATFAPAGAWTASTYSTGQYYGSEFMQTVTGGAVATYTPNLAAGTYRVYARWASDGDRTAEATYTITHKDGTTVVTKSQRTGGGLWVDLGTYSFAAGMLGNVKISMAGSGPILTADAIRFQQ